MSEGPPTRNRLDRPVDPRYDHVLGPPSADLTLVEYGSYACPYCRVANEEIAKLRDRFGDRLRYCFRQRPLTDNDLARRAALSAESAPEEERFWAAHAELMTRSHSLTEDDLIAVARDQGLPVDDRQAMARAEARLSADVLSADASGVQVTPTFFINGRRYDGPWDEVTLGEALLGSLGHRVHSAAVDFARWAPATGVLLLLMSILAVALANLPVGEAVAAFWETPVGLFVGEVGFRMSLLHWIDDALLSVFFLVVGLEIKRELTVGRLASPRAAALPIAAAIGGMIVPALLYSLAIPEGPWERGWGVPMATDTAFAVALIVSLGSRVPVELRIFLTAAAIVDDLVAILVVALFYSGELHWDWLAFSLLLVGGLALLNRSGIYRAMPYAVLGVALWVAFHEGGLHATLAGVLLAMLIPTRPPPNLNALMAQANTILLAEAARGPTVLRHGPSVPALEALNAVHDRLESPAGRVLRAVEPWSSFLVLPLFALANAGVLLSTEVLEGRESLTLAIVLGLAVGKPVGLLLGAALAVWSGLAVKPAAYSWRQLAGAGALAGIGFTMSLFIAGQAFPLPEDFAAAKLGIFGASILSAMAGWLLLLKRYRSESEESAAGETGERPGTPLEPGGVACPAPALARSGEAAS